MTQDRAPGAGQWQRDALPRDTMVHGYRVSRIIGRGGFGITYAVADAIDQTFAMKECFPRQFACRDGLVVQPSGADDEGPFADCLNRFIREAKSLVALSARGAATEGIVKVVTLFETNGTAYLVMELLAGQTMAERLAKQPQGLPGGEIRGLMLGVLRALETVHAVSMLHRDIKPANIFLRSNGRPALIDFGAARTTAHGQNTTFTQIYSEAYAPLEQMTGEVQTPASDLYAFGATFYKAIGGKLQDALSRQRDLLAGKPDPLIPAIVFGAGRFDDSVLRTIDACLRPRAEDRPQSVQDAICLMDGADEATTIIAPGIAPGCDGDATLLAPIEQTVIAPPTTQSALSRKRGNTVQAHDTTAQTRSTAGQRTDDAEALPAPKEPSRKRLWLWAGGGVAATIGVIGTVMALSSGQKQQTPPPMADIAVPAPAAPVAAAPAATTATVTTATKANAAATAPSSVSAATSPTPPTDAASGDVTSPAAAGTNDDTKTQKPKLAEEKKSREKTVTTRTQTISKEREMAQKQAAMQMQKTLQSLPKATNCKNALDFSLGINCE